MKAQTMKYFLVLTRCFMLQNLRMDTWKYDLKFNCGAQYEFQFYFFCINMQCH